MTRFQHGLARILLAAIFALHANAASAQSQALPSEETAGVPFEQTEAVPSEQTAAVPSERIAAVSSEQTAAVPCEQNEVYPDAQVRLRPISANQNGQLQLGSGADTAPAANLPVKYWGNSFSLKFHRPSCPFAQAMSANHVIFFNFRKEAVEAGQVPCRYCLPPTWNSVKAVLLNPAHQPSSPASQAPGREAQPQNVMPP